MSSDAGAGPTVHATGLLAAVASPRLRGGKIRVIMLETQPVRRQGCRIVDVKTGVVEAGVVGVGSMRTRPPWPRPGDENPVHRAARRGPR
ncbi:MAG: DUF3556 domain-containing protein [Mycobacterium sp.]|nr:DUF3556 domain-containing protein [Mycobacterium sp.]